MSWLEKRKGEREYELGRQYYRQQKYIDAEPLFRESAQQREKVLGAEHVNTLNTKYWLAHTLYSQEKYTEAEWMFQESAQLREKVLGTEHVDTLNSKFWLARMLYSQEKCSEAERMFQESAQQHEKVLGADHKDTLWSKYWLAKILREQQKYIEAEPLFRESAQRREKVLGAEHIHTLRSKYWLAYMLHEQRKYAEAELLFRESAQQREKVLGAEDINTLNSKYWLARTLYSQEKDAEVERLFQESAQQREKVLGAEDANTLDSKYWLARTLCSKERYTEAEWMFRESAQQREKVLGAEDVDTLDSKYWLACTLYSQEKYTEAERLLRESAQQREKVLGADHKDTLASKKLLQKVILAEAPSALTNTLAEIVSSRLSDFFVDSKQTQTAYTDSEIQQVARLLSPVNLHWSKVPRTYIILRIIDCLELLDEFIDLGVSDFWLPFTNQSLPRCVRPSKRSQFVSAQKLVMTKSMNLEKGETGRHCYFREHESLPLEMKGILGSGGFGQVNRVLSTISFREYALKRVPRSTIFSGRTAEHVKQFITEISILKGLKHHHVVEFIGSYTDLKYIGLLMSPIADMDLSTYLARADTAKYKELRTFFGCLTRALEFLHRQRIRHKDIKPSNILVHGGNVLFTDFGLAFNFTDQDRSTTVSMVNGMTPKYCAPEVADYEPRNTSSDIWSLGVVFLEMTAVLKDRTVEYMYDFLKEYGSGLAYVRTNPTGTRALIAELKETGNSTDNVVLGWVQDMIMPQQQLRPTAALLMASIASAGQKGGGNEAFCGICCASRDNILDDFDELEIADAV